MLDHLELLRDDVANCICFKCVDISIVCCIISNSYIHFNTLHHISQLHCFGGMNKKRSRPRVRDNNNIFYNNKIRKLGVYQSTKLHSELREKKIKGKNHIIVDSDEIGITNDNRVLYIYKNLNVSNNNSWGEFWEGQWNKLEKSSNKLVETLDSLGKLKPGKTCRGTHKSIYCGFCFQQGSSQNSICIAKHHTLPGVSDWIKCNQSFFEVNFYNLFYIIFF